MTEERTKVKVVFRVIEGEVVAVMPEMPGTSEYDCTSYAHVGQHGAASLDLLRSGRPARPDEYASLLRELDSIGYDVRVVKRVNHSAAMEARRKTL